MQDWIGTTYLATLACLALYGLHRLWMLVGFRWSNAGDTRSEGEDCPPVTVQLPVYNERTVAARLIRAAGELDYPPDRLEIQVLDDSNDDTRGIVDREVEGLRERGLRAEVIRRADRAGYKAGALAYGTERCEGEFLCIFDADFLPRAGFLRDLMPHFEDPRIGMVQARWDHVNRDESRLTRAQSTLLDGHFVIEHTVRHDRGLFFNFNGTAGIWRRETIVDAGGWEHDTLTEDLDLSYRAQLKGWRFVYAPAVTAPAEIPPDIAAFKSQQHRWAKGSAQVARKLTGTIWSSNQPLRVKLEAFLHLTGNVGYPLVLLLAILMPLVVGYRPGGLAANLHLISFLACTLSVLAFYEGSQRAIGRPLRKRLGDTVAAVLLGIGMCVSQTRAVVEGLFARTGEFVRTPKRGDRILDGSQGGDTLAPEASRDPGAPVSDVRGPSPRPESGIQGYRVALRGLPGLELLLACWFIWGCVQAVRIREWGALPFLGLFLAGFGWVGVESLRHRLRLRAEGARG